MRVELYFSDSGLCICSGFVPIGPVFSYYVVAYDSEEDVCYFSFDDKDVMSSLSGWVIWVLGVFLQKNGL